MRRAIMALALLTVLAGCQSMRVQPQPPPQRDFFVVFFAPGTIRLPPEAQDIVRQAADTAVGIRASRIEVAIPIDPPGGTSLREGRFTAIQNIFSASGVPPRLYANSPLATPAAMLLGANDRAEIRLIP